MTSREGLESPISPGSPPGDSPEEGAAAAASTPEVRLDPAKGDREQDTEKDKGAAKEPIPGGPATEPPVFPGRMARGKTCRVLFASRGYATWEEEIQKTVEGLNPRQAMAEIEETIANHRYHVSVRYLDGDRLVVVRKGPGDLAKRKGRKVWLDWWTGLQPEIRQDWRKIKILISPSMDILDSTDLQRHGENLRAGAIEELALTNRKVIRENADLKRQNQKYRWGEESRKSTCKTNRDSVKEEREPGGAEPSTLGGSTPEHRPKLKAISNPTKTRTRPGGTTIITWVGDPWTINGDVLLVVTDWELNILNSKFRYQLAGRVGRGYQPELK